MSRICVTCNHPYDAHSINGCTWTPDCRCKTFIEEHTVDDSLMSPTIVNDEMVNHPQHYGGNTVYEVIKVLRAWGLTKSFNLGNAVKYIARAGKKNEDTYVEDLKKAIWYLQDEINSIEHPLILVINPGDDDASDRP